MLASGTMIIGNRVIFEAATHDFTRTDLLDPGTAKIHVSINGPKNILLVGIDARPDQNPNDPIRSDSIMILHIPTTHDRAFLVSIPRDSYVEIPPYNNGVNHFRGARDRINAAFAYGGAGLAGMDARKHGFRLLQQTIKADFGVRFDAGAIVDFMGFKDVVEALGGVDMYVDEKVTSIHVGFTKDGVQKVPFEQNGGSSIRPIRGVTPKVYDVGPHHFQPWEALDYVRQRDLLQNGDSDYGRQRHQQQFIKAVFKAILNKGILSDPTRLPGLLKVVGKAMTIDDGHIGMEDWIFAMRSIGASDVVTIKTNGGQFNPGQGDLRSVEMISPESMQLFAAIRNDAVDAFISVHSDWVSATG
jgi:LCP family protein required for cell wall assembly